ncbi:MAG: AI-2E family transporter [Lachnospiraceae bacterium]|nr:AI-2E family transporter [Lachnospiraceae bacterium]
MGFDKVKMRQIRGLLIFAAALVLLIIYSGSVWSGIEMFFGILTPFLAGGAIAFVLNMPMNWVEKKWFGKWNGRVAAKMKRPISMVIAILLIVLIVALIMLIIVPQVGESLAELGVQIPAFFNSTLVTLTKLANEYPEILEQVKELQNIKIDWDTVINTVVDFLKNGMGNVLTVTVTAAGSLIGGIVNTFIAFIFAIYILSQKENLARQRDKLLDAYLPEIWSARIKKVMKLMYKNFSNFVSGQCIEAVILGCMFVIAMAIFGFPYAVMVGTLIAVTALIPVVGAFIGCFVGAFLILINDPLQAVWFIVMFLIIQQIEGNLIYPRVVGSSVGLPSIWVLVAVSLGGSLFGVAGMLLFIPLLSTVYALVRENANGKLGIVIEQQEAPVDKKEMESFFGKKKGAVKTDVKDKKTADGAEGKTE